MEVPLNALPPLFREGNRPHSWTSDEKFVLCVLQRFYKSRGSFHRGAAILNRCDRTAIMRAYFAPAFKDSITMGAFDARFQQMRGDCDAEYLSVFQASISQFKRLWPVEKKRIEQTARRHHVPITIKTAAECAKAKLVKLRPRKRKRTSRFRDLGVLGAPSDAETSTDGTSEAELATTALHESPRRPALRSGRSALSGPAAAITHIQTFRAPLTPNVPVHTATGILSPPPTAQKAPQSTVQTKTGLTVSPLAPARGSRLITSPCEGFDASMVGWRAQGRSSHTIGSPLGLRAGKNGEMAIGPMPPMESEVFSVEAYCHLRPLTRSSSFISVSSLLPPALHRALVSPTNDGAYVCLIDLHHLDKNTTPGGRSRLFRASDIISTHSNHWFDEDKTDLFPRPRGEGRNLEGYHGRYEFLVWGSIEKEAIIACFFVAEFRAFLEAKPLLSQLLSIQGFERAKHSSHYRRVLYAVNARQTFESGLVIGEMLQFFKTPERWVQAVAANIASSWLDLREAPDKRLRSLPMYLQGVKRGWKGLPPPTCLSPANPDRPQPTVRSGRPADSGMARGPARTGYTATTIGPPPSEESDSETVVGEIVPDETDDEAEALKDDFMDSRKRITLGLSAMR